jgi:ubiquinone/menaquinone biosynthesis C-methylase UbiE
MPQPPEFFVGTEMPTAGWWEALWPDPAAVLDIAGLTAGARAVDLCSGDGWFTLQIAKIAATVVAIDIDASLLDLARHRVRESGVNNVRFVTGNAFDLPRLVAEPASYVFMANAFHGVPDRERLATAVWQTLAPDGRFAIVNWHTRPREETIVLGEPRGPKTELRVSPADTIAAVRPSGLRLVQEVDVPPYHYAVIFRR